jgi:hypothetical protein
MAQVARKHVVVGEVPLSFVPLLVSWSKGSKPA